jgi:hypothetical protein
MLRIIPTIICMNIISIIIGSIAFVNISLNIFMKSSIILLMSGGVLI